MSHLLATLISAHGYWIVAAAVALESMGSPVPGSGKVLDAKDGTIKDAGKMGLWTTADSVMAFDASQSAGGES